MENLTEQVNGVEKLARTNSRYGKDNTMTGFFMVIMLMLMGWILWSNSKMQSDNRKDMETLVKSNQTFIDTNAKFIDTNAKLVAIIQNDLSSIKETLKMDEKEVNTYVLEEKVVNGENVLSPVKINK